jgi:hypothetical protein
MQFARVTQHKPSSWIYFLEVVEKVDAFLVYLGSYLFNNKLIVELLNIS